MPIWTWESSCLYAEKVYQSLMFDISRQAKQLHAFCLAIRDRRKAKQTCLHHGRQHQHRAGNTPGTHQARTHRCLAEPAIGHEPHGMLPRLRLLQHRYCTPAAHLLSAWPRLFQTLFREPQRRLQQRTFTVKIGDASGVESHLLHDANHSAPQWYIFSAPFATTHFVKQFCYTSVSLLLHVNLLETSAIVYFCSRICNNSAWVLAWGGCVC